MWYRALADLLVIAHLMFVLFVVLGGLLVRRFPRIAWLHLPAAAWGAISEFTGWICPLTPWEQSLHRLGGEAGYAGGFIEHYLLPVLYPPGLTSTIQILLGLIVVCGNAAIYGTLLRQRSRRDSSPRGGAGG
jgi:hypothetical protein